MAGVHGAGVLKLSAKWFVLGWGMLALASPVVAAVQLPDGPHLNLVYGKCRTCHDLQYLKDSKGITKAQWDGVLSTMQSLGLEVTDSQRKNILQYLGTYLGPNPPTPFQAQANSDRQVSGKEVYAGQCVSCHQPNGHGVADEFPPLAGNADLYRSQEFPALVVLNGLRGKIAVGGSSYDGQMPSFSFLSDAEIAGVVNYIRSSWGNQPPKSGRQLTAQDVAGMRDRELSPIDVHAYRSSHEPGGS